MSGKIRFGPAGRPVEFTGATPAIPAYLRSMGLDAFEYQAVRGVRVRDEIAQLLRVQAEKYDVEVSMHAPYYINFSSEKEATIEKSVQWLRLAAEAAHKMGAHIAVFHPGYYGSRSPQEAMEIAVNAIRKVEEYLKAKGIKDVSLGAETTGKKTQLGSLEEVIELSLRLEMVKPVIDWAHLYARSSGEFIRSMDDVLQVLDVVEKNLGSSTLKNLHMHYSRVEYGRGGEREHHILAEDSYGPDYTVICMGLREVGVEGTLISETPLLDRDAVVMRDIYLKGCRGV